MSVMANFDFCLRDTRKVFKEIESEDEDSGEICGSHNSQDVLELDHIDEPDEWIGQGWEVPLLSRAQTTSLDTIELSIVKKHCKQAK
jgi:hypothetical protein